MSNLKFLEISNILIYDTFCGIFAIKIAKELPGANLTIIGNWKTWEERHEFNKNITLTGKYFKTFYDTKYTLSKLLREGCTFDIIFYSDSLEHCQYLAAPASFICCADDMKFRNFSPPKNVFINGKPYTVREDEFTSSPTQFDSVENVSHVNELEREVYFWKKMVKFEFINILVHNNVKCGGFLPLNCAFVKQQTRENFDRMSEVNLTSESLGNFWGMTTHVPVTESPAILYSSCQQPFLSQYTKYNHYEKFVFVRDDIVEMFNAKLNIVDNNIQLNGLLHLVIMVKNAGDGFREILEKNIELVDECTILDTGSTDNTLDIARDIFAGRNFCNLYCEPFINFRDSRNRALELAGDDCTFSIILDDTYVMDDVLYNFLDNVLRSDQSYSSYSIHIYDGLMRYTSNRIIRNCYDLKYIYRLHEIIESNTNGAIPFEISHIKDVQSKYMTTRSLNRKKYDLKMLELDLEDYPNNPRTLYYIGETLYTQENWERAIEFYERRVQIKEYSYIPEIQDSYFKIGYIYDKFLNDWEKAEVNYMKSYECDKEKYDGLAMIAEHYFLTKDQRAWTLYKICWNTGPPDYTHTFSRYESLYSYWVPRRMMEYFNSIGNYEEAERIAREIPAQPPT